VTLIRGIIGFVFRDKKGRRFPKMMTPRLDVK